VFVEDAGPQVRLVERERRPDDVVLEHAKTLFIYGYYQTAIPVLVPSRAVSTGYLPWFADPRVQVVTARALAGNAQRALRSGARVWFLASRQRRGDELWLRSTLARFGTIAHEDRRRGAFLLLVKPPPTHPPPG
jgi:hypothetical protein